MFKRIYTLGGLFARKRKKPSYLLKSILGFTPKRVELYTEALSHASLNGKSNTSKKKNNERLEYLGDSVLNTVVSHIIYNMYPNKREGFLSTLRARIVQRKSLDSIANAMDIQSLLHKSTEVNTTNNHIGGNALEAIIGAIYIDKGYNTCYKFIKEKIIDTHINIEELIDSPDNYKSMLMEWGQKRKLNILYREQKVDNPNLFKFSVEIEGKELGNGTGHSKKEAQQVAAKEVYNKITTNAELLQQIFTIKNGKNRENRVTSHPNNTQQNTNNIKYKAMKNKALLMILDGWGVGNHDKADVISATSTPYWDYLVANYPNSQLQASGENVGLPDGQMGNSEVGHLNIGAGRIVYQDLVKINKACSENTIMQNSAIVEAFSYAKANSKKVHLMGLTSNGGVHSSLDHLYKLCDIAAQYEIENTFIHCFMDGRDTDPKSGKGFIEEILNNCDKTTGKIATIIGRYYAMDRDKRWDRVKEAYDLLVNGVGTAVENLPAAVEASYQAGVTDEFIKPLVNSSCNGKIEEGDVVIFFNYRNDRAKELTQVLSQQDMPEEGMKTIPAIKFYCMTPYDSSFTGVDIIFNKENVTNTLGEYLSAQGKSQLHIAETEKYAHVTFFFNGGREMPYDGEERILVPSPKVATYDLQPEMSAYEVKDKLVEAIKEDKYDFIVVNFANGDMVGHTGIYEAIEKAVVAVDNCVKDVIEAAKETGYESIIIADHGNADNAVNNDGSPNTAHSLNPVPCVYVTENKDAKIENGILADVAPTILQIMGLEKPAEITGAELIK